jgi:hypothetical protein
MYESTADKVFPSRLVYPYDFNKANYREETSYYHKNRSMNQECAHAIDEAITASCYRTYYYNLEIAAMSVIGRHGFNRVNAVLAYHIQKRESDGRYSNSVKKWARHFIIQENTHDFLNSHAVLIDSFADYTRELNTDLGAKCIALPGKEEHGEDVNGYTVIRTIMIDKQQGYAIAHDAADNSYVCWQFMVRDGKRDYNWGIYGDEQAAVDGYNARLFVQYN